MTSQPTPQTNTEKFQTNEVLTIVGGHFVHDTFSAFVPSLLPLMIERLSLSLASAALLQNMLQLPTLLIPLLGYLADKVSLRYFVIFAPAVTATLMSLLGLAPNYATLLIILLITGFSIAAFHAPAPAMIGRISGNQVGKGMSFFMAGGELGRAFSPLLITGAIFYFTLEGYFPIMILGWGTSAILFWRLSRVPARSIKSQNILPLLPIIRRLFIPLFIITFLRAFLLASLAIFLPTFMTMQGYSFAWSNSALAIWEFAGVGGALLGGTLSDRLGRQMILLIGITSSSLLTIVFLFTSGWLVVPVLILLGFTALSTSPVMLAVSQEHLPDNRAMGSGIYISLGSISRLITIYLIGLIGDQVGLEAAFLIGAILSLCSIPFIFRLPKLSHP